MREVQDIDLSGCPIGDDGVKAIAECRKWTRLRKLAIAGVGLTYRGLSALTESRQLSSLLSLDIRSFSGEFDDRCATALANSTFGMLVELSMPDAEQCNMEAVRRLACTRLLSRLDTFTQEAGANEHRWWSRQTVFRPTVIAASTNLAADQLE